MLSTVLTGPTTAGSTRRPFAGVLLLSTWFAATASVRAQVLPAREGAEFQVNTYTTGSQGRPSVGAAANGSFIVVWQSLDQDGSNYGVFGRRYDASGTPLGGSEFRVNAYTTYVQFLPKVASDASGDVVVVWESIGQDGSASGVFGRRFNSAGLPVGTEFQVNSATTSAQSSPSIASDPSGNFVVVWESLHSGASDIFAKRYNAAGAPQGSEFRVNAYTSGTQRRPSVAADGSGNLVVVWDSDFDGSNYGVFGRRYDATGTPQGAEFRVNSYTTGAQTLASVASDASGNFVVVWESLGQDGSSQGIFGRRFDSAGTPRRR
jgi:hypothetical protein